MDLYTISTCVSQVSILTGYLWRPHAKQKTKTAVLLNTSLKLKFRQ